MVHLSARTAAYKWMASVPVFHADELTATCIYVDKDTRVRTRPAIKIGVWLVGEMRLANNLRKQQYLWHATAKGRVAIHCHGPRAA